MPLAEHDAPPEPRVMKRSVCAYCGSTSFDVDNARYIWLPYVCCSAGYGQPAMREATGERISGFLRGLPGSVVADVRVPQVGPWIDASGVLVP